MTRISNALQGPVLIPDVFITQPCLWRCLQWPQLSYVLVEALMKPDWPVLDSVLCMLRDEAALGDAAPGNGSPGPPAANTFYSSSSLHLEHLKSSGEDVLRPW